MELKHLRYFKAVAEELNFRKAAEKLHMSQPPLSQQIKELESSLGVSLFQRLKNGNKLTEAGKILYQYTVEIFERADLAEEHIKAIRAAPYLVRVMAESFGTMQGTTFVGMPPVQSVLIPFSLPELTLYKNQSQSGYARLHMDVFDNRTGEFLGSTPKLIGRAFYNQYTVLILATWHRTDITAPPVAGQ